jgi:hypothetical protein
MHPFSSDRHTFRRSLKDIARHDNFGSVTILIVAQFGEITRLQRPQKISRGRLVGIGQYPHIVNSHTTSFPQFDNLGALSMLSYQSSSVHFSLVGKVIEQDAGGGTEESSFH